MLRTTRAALRTTRTRRALTLCAAGAAALALSVPDAHAAPAAATAQAGPAAQAAPAAQQDGPLAQHRHRHTGPEIHRFLTWFYGESGPTDWQREHFVSDFLKQKQADNPDHDVLLCAQNTPRNIDVGPVTTAQSAGVGWATVTASWADGTTSTFTAYVALDSHPIELHEVVCAQ
ncbi:hypothetical protein ITI46_23800 [Streptomyces oryzae]|uniref:Secreted protein n=1 Tax=Streptomyces oryzae TaxID=1434886 RepID=A0ABS3XGX1_9ACTN|nr:hypothetical protein [Streptomyces oryzae]MBO8194655.1 hypothetical protein [Streptomyces oryzae]